jgi:hypothetical protein
MLSETIGGLVRGELVGLNSSSDPLETYPISRGRSGMTLAASRTVLLGSTE